MFVFGVISIEAWPTQMPVWALLLALIIGMLSLRIKSDHKLISYVVAFVYTIPIGIIQAITNQQIALNVITELIVGYMLPGKPIAMMMFKTWGYIVSCRIYKYLYIFAGC